MEAIAIFTGSRDGKLDEYTEAARATGRTLAERGLRLVYGGGRVGLMGVVADAALEAGGEVIGVIPGFLADQEVAHEGLTQLEIVDSMDERKQRFEALSDGFIALPGGFGTLDELFEVLTGAQLMRHSKPIGLLNTEYYFDPLLGVAEKMLLDGFIQPHHMGLMLNAVEIDQLLDEMLRYKSVTAIKKCDWREDAMANKTVATKKSVGDFLKSVANTERRKDAKTVMKMLAEITGKRPKMWGPSMIGYDSYHYRYESGREGDAVKIGLSPRAQDLTIYIMPGFDDFKADLKKLGKHRVGKSCLYIKNLDDVDLGVLKRIMKASYQEMNKRYG